MKYTYVASGLVCGWRETERFYGYSCSFRIDCTPIDDGVAAMQRAEGLVSIHTVIEVDTMFRRSLSQLLKVRERFHIIGELY